MDAQTRIGWLSQMEANSNHTLLQTQEVEEGDGNKNHPKAPQLPGPGWNLLSAHHTMGSRNRKSNLSQRVHGELQGELLTSRVQ